MEQGIDHIKASPVKLVPEIKEKLAALNSPPLNNHSTLYGLLKRYEIAYDDLAEFPGWTTFFLKSSIRQFSGAGSDSNSIH